MMCGGGYFITGNHSFSSDCDRGISILSTSVKMNLIYLSQDSKKGPVNNIASEGDIHSFFGLLQEEFCLLVGPCLGRQASYCFTDLMFNSELRRSMISCCSDLWAARFSSP